MSDSGKIPFLDLVGLHAEMKDELTEVFQAAIGTAGFIGGPMVSGFEADFAAYCGTAHAVGVASGTDALLFAYMAAGIGAGDAVITAPNTFIATSEAITQAGARPVFVDIDEATYNLDAGKVRAYLENQCRRVDGRVVETRSGLRVAALVPVHLYGQPADMDAFLALGEEFGLTVMEDACQAHGAEYYSAREGRWRRAGSMGRAAAFSFYPGKNLGACGEGGAVTTNDAALAAKIRVLRDHGQSKKYYHEVEGFNGRLDAIQAGILQKKLKRLPTWTEQRRAAAERYRKLFEAAECDVMLPWEPTWAKAVYHLYVIRAQRRDELMQVLGAAGIGSALHYPVPLHLQEAYQYLGHREGDFPVTEKVTKEIVSLPMFPALTEEQQARVVAHTTSFVTAAVKAG